jgi:hypothetical protein
VLERLNSVLEPGRTLTLAERGGEGAEVVHAAEGFRCAPGAGRRALGAGRWALRDESGLGWAAPPPLPCRCPAYTHTHALQYLPSPPPPNPGCWPP